MSYSIVSGVAENNDVEYCPYCGIDRGLQYRGDGSVKCMGCNKIFYVVEDDET